MHQSQVRHRTGRDVGENVRAETVTCPFNSSHLPNPFPTAFFRQMLPSMSNINGIRILRFSKISVPGRWS